MRPFALVLFGCALLVIGCAYKPGSFASSNQAFVGQRASVGCLDVSIDRRPDRGSWAVLDYSFGNRCDGPATVDLAWTQVIGRSIDGAEVALVPYDPEAQLAVMKLDGRLTGREALAYPANVKLGQVCVDVASIAQERPARWLCFGSTEAIAMLDLPVTR